MRVGEGIGKVGNGRDRRGTDPAREREREGERQAMQLREGRREETVY